MRRRFSIIELLALVAIAALGLAAMRDGSDFALGATLSVTILALLVALLATFLRASPVGAWAGFALFGWAAFLLTFIPYFEDLYEDLPCAVVIQRAADSLHRQPPRPSGLSVWINQFSSEDVVKMTSFQNSTDRVFKNQLLDWDRHLKNSLKIGRAINCLLLALVGSLIGRFLASRREPAGPDSA